MYTTASYQEMYRQANEAAIQVGYDYMTGAIGIDRVQALILNCGYPLDGPKATWKLIAKGVQRAIGEGVAIPSRVQPEQDPEEIKAIYSRKIRKPRYFMKKAVPVQAELPVAVTVESSTVSVEPVDEPVEPAQPVLAVEASASPMLPFNASILAGRLAQSSIDMYERDFAAYLRFAGTPEAALDARTLARWLTTLASDTRMSPNTINRMLSAVKRLMKEAANQGYTTHETASAFEQVSGVKVSALKERTKQTARTRISPEAMRELTDAPDTRTLVGLRDSALLHTLASSGLRASELASLTQAQIVKQGNGYLVRVRGKNDTEYRDAHLSVKAHDAVLNWLEARPVVSAYIFTSFQGRGDSRATHEPMTEVAVWQTITKYAAKVGLENVKPHDLRRFVGTQLAKQDIRKAQKALGHKRIDTTARHYVLDEIEVGLTDNLY